MVWRLRTIFYKQFFLTDNENNFDETLNDNNYKRTVRELHDYGCKNCYFTSADVAMISHGCGVSMYPQFYDQHLEE